MNNNAAEDYETQAFLIAEPYLRKLCQNRWKNLEPEDRMGEASLFFVGALRCLPNNSGHFFDELQAQINPHMDELNRKTPSPYYGTSVSLDCPMSARDGDNTWTMLDFLPGKNIDKSRAEVCSFLKALTELNRNIVLDLINGLSKTDTAQKYNLSIYELNKRLEQIGEAYRDGVWQE